MKRTGENIVILLVDNDADCRLLIRDAISQSKIRHIIFEVPDGPSALDFVFQRGDFAHMPRPGLIYLDLEMPGMSGQEVLKIIRASPAHREIPIVMMTGVCDEREMRLAARNGANSYTLKPANAEQFLQTVQASTDYWTSIHQHPQYHWAQEECRR